MAIDAGELELAAIRRQFCNVIARWRLTQAELRSILGQCVDPIAEGSVLPSRLNADAERRMRLLVRLDNALDKHSPDRDVALMMRQADSFGHIPLELLAELTDLRLAVALAEEACVCPMTPRSPFEKAPLVTSVHGMRST